MEVLFAAYPRPRGKLPEGGQRLPGRLSASRLRSTGMALSVLVVLLLAVLYESIKVGKAKLLHQAVVSMSVLSSQQLIEETDQDSSASDSAPVGRTRLRYQARCVGNGRVLTFTPTEGLGPQGISPTSQKANRGPRKDQNLPKCFP